MIYNYNRKKKNCKFDFFILQNIFAFHGIQYKKRYTIDTRIGRQEKRMNRKSMEQELYGYYLQGDGERAKAFAGRCFEIMDAQCKDDMSVLEQKCLQYDVITEEFEPVVFRSVPYYYETGVLTSLSDGARTAKNYGFLQANGWVYERNQHRFEEQDPELFKRRNRHIQENLYLICGPYNDDSQHFNFNCRPFLEIGIKGIYEKAKSELAKTENPDEKEFLQSVCHGMLCLKKMAGKFAVKAKRMLEDEENPDYRYNLQLIADTAQRVPWEAPETLYEALATLAFLRCAMGSLEGAGPNTFGRVDKDLLAFYQADIQKGILTKEQAYEYICLFLLIWDLHYDHDMIMAGYADHELENTYTIGGCDDDGIPLYNELTAMFLKATREENIIFPKIKCRFSKNSPKEYLDQINEAIAKGVTTVLLQNDDATIPAMLRAGRTIAEARDYMISGCWGMATFQEKFDHGSYLNLLKPFEYSIHNMKETIEAVGIPFECWDPEDDFEVLYRKTINNCEKVLDAKLDVTRKGGQILHTVDQFPIFSSTLENCLETHKDFIRRGAKYQDDYQLIFGLPNIVDSLSAIKSLVFEKKKYTLSEYLTAVRANWEGYEKMRLEAIACPGWGDGSQESCELAARFNKDLYTICQKKQGTYGGKVHMGHLTYTEIRFWGEKTMATPDGRRDGEYFAQGLTPSRLKRIPNVTDVIYSMKALDASQMAGNSVVNLILPGRMPVDQCTGLLYAIAGSAVQSLQLNCVSKEELLDAQKHPEAHQNLIIRVTGFSAKFTSLTPEWQNEVLSRNFYE